MTSVISTIIITILQLQLSPVISDSLEETLKNQKYDENLRPLTEDRKPTIVTNQINVIQLSEFRTDQFTYDIEYLLRQWWYDPRLARNTSHKTATTNNNEESHDESDHTTYDRDVGIWLPRLYVENSGTDRGVEDGRVAVLIKPNGNVFRSERRKAR